jgi:hypothetical protein
MDPDWIPKEFRDDPDPIPARSRTTFGMIPAEFGIKSGSNPVSPLDFGIKKNNSFADCQ